MRVVYSHSQGRYIFLIDIEGHREDRVVREALEGIRARATMFKVLGSYPRAAGEGLGAVSDARRISTLHLKDSRPGPASFRLADSSNDVSHGRDQVCQFALADFADRHDRGNDVRLPNERYRFGLSDAGLW